jgi:hypothetical protein
MRPVVQLHTIEQWSALDKPTQDTILRAIKIRDRLWAWRLVHEQQKNSNPPPEGWYACKRCEQRGWVYQRPRKAGIHPSALHSVCLLKIYYEAIGVEQEVAHEARELLIFDIGTACHGMLQHFGAHGVWGSSYVPEVPIEETPVAKELGIVGHADADNILVIDEIPGAPIFEVGIVHEYKTINSKGFDNLHGKPKPQHIQQATIYSKCLNRPIVDFLYLNKDNSNIQDFPVPFMPHIWEEMEKRAITVRDAVASGTPPHGNTGYHCGQCGYIYQCEAYKLAHPAQKG